jgi:hypothetical protein
MTTTPPHRRRQAPHRTPALEVPALVRGDRHPRDPPARARAAHGFHNPANQLLRTRCVTTRRARGHLRTRSTLKTLVTSRDRPRLLHERSHWLCDGRPLPDPLDIPSHQQHGAEQEAHSGCNISFRPRKQLHVSRVREDTEVVRSSQICRPYRICFDNAMAESSFGTLKNERVSRVTYLPTRPSDRTSPDTSNSGTVANPFTQHWLPPSVRSPRRVTEVANCRVIKRPDTCPKNARPLASSSHTSRGHCSGL